MSKVLVDLNLSDIGMQDEAILQLVSRGGSPEIWHLQWQASTTLRRGVTPYDSESYFGLSRKLNQTVLNDIIEIIRVEK